MGDTLTPTKVVNDWDRSSPEDANVEMFQRVLDRITTDLDAWEQSSFCELRDEGVVDPLVSNEVVTTGVYHDVALPERLLEQVREAYTHDRGRHALPRLLPVSTCGTAFCVAGHVASVDGWTFMAEPDTTSTHQVMPTADVQRYLETGDLTSTAFRPVAGVARESLNINYSDSDLLFSGGNLLIDIWALSYAMTAGRLKLPASLPATYTGTYDRHVLTAELDDPEDVADAINLRLAARMNFAYHRILGRYIDTARLQALIDTYGEDDTMARLDRFTRSGDLPPSLNELHDLLDFAWAQQDGTAPHVMTAAVVEPTA
jgi:hypothetical protein